MSTRSQNEKKFDGWEELSGGGGRYRLDVAGKLGWQARYFKEVDADKGKLMEVHEKFPVDKGHKKV